MKRPFLIHTPSYDENVGGIMVLHYLCHLLNGIGETAYLYDAAKPLHPDKSPLSRLNQLRKRISRRIRGDKEKAKAEFKTNPLFDTPLGDHQLIDEAIVIYPEVIDGNPLSASRVVRWLLYKPGFFVTPPSFSGSELIFAYRREFNTMEDSLGEVPELNVQYIMTDVYRQTNHGERKGTCFILRKGNSSHYIHDDDAIQIDGKGHKEISRLFNECETFISYDPHTYYSTYASLCGCTSVVISDHKRTPDSQPPGIAIGHHDIARAKETRHLLFDRIREIKKSNLKSVRAFAKACHEFFPGSGSSTN